MPLIQSSTFKGNKFLSGKHIDTIVPAIFRQLTIQYTREKITLADGDFLSLDWIQHQSKKVLILFHGLEGSSASQYIQGFAKYFSAKDWDICAVNYRSCGGETNKLLRSYHSGATEDIDAVMKHIQTQYTYNELVAIGFSLGGNMLLKYLGEQTFSIPNNLMCACAFSVPIDLAASSAEISKFKNRIYLNRFLRSLTQKMRTKALLFPNDLDISKLHEIKTFEAFDTRYTGPIHGFKDAKDYYAQNNALQFLHSITIPTLLINAQNDPFLTPSCFPIELAYTHSQFYVEYPLWGGHVGFADRLPNGTYWSENRAESFISEYCS
jgi:predicted alpha/beta-fold hydrolase